MAANLTARLSLDGRGFRTGIRYAKMQVRGLRKHVGKQFTGMLKSYGALFGTAMIGRQVAATLEWASEIKSISRQFGLTTDMVQKLRFAAESSGLKIGTVMDAMKDLGENTQQAIMGVASKRWAFKQFGIDVEEIKHANLDEIFMRVAKSIENMKAPLSSKDVKAMNELMGQSGFNSIKMFRLGLEDLFARLEEMGGIVDEATINRISSISTKMKEFKTQNRSVWADIVGFAAGVWMGLVNVLTAAIDTIAERLVSAWSALGKLASAAGHVWEAIKSRSMSDLKKANKDLQAAAEDISFAAGGEQGRQAAMIIGGDTKISSKLKAFAGGIGNALTGGGLFGDIGKKMAGKEDKLEAGIKSGKEEEKIKTEIQEIGRINESRNKILSEIDKLEEKAEERRFKQLSPEKQLLELTKKRKEELDKLNKLRKPLADIEKDARLEGLKGKEYALMLGTLSQEEKAYKEQQLLAAEAMDQEKAAKGEKKILSSGEMSGSLKDTYTSLSKIGGQIGGKNPLLTNAEKSLKVAEEQKEYLATITRIQSITFGP